jgi:hypothetical protein
MIKRGGGKVKHFCNVSKNCNYFIYSFIAKIIYSFVTVLAKTKTAMFLALHLCIMCAWKSNATLTPRQ